jgi:hypothetical protein
VARALIDVSRAAPPKRASSGVPQLDPPAVEQPVVPNVASRQPGKTLCKGAAGSSCGAPLKARFGGAPRDSSVNVRTVPALPPGLVVDARIAHPAPNGQRSSFLGIFTHKTCTRHYEQLTNRVGISSFISSNDVILILT